MNYVWEVNEQDEVLGQQEKLYAHQQGILHRAFSIFVFNNKNELILQQRADGKYHCGGLWTNTCCSHPSPNEDTLTAAHRRLVEEMGFDCDLTFLQKYRYKATLENGLIENELDYIYMGFYDGKVTFTPKEVQAIKYIRLQELRQELYNYPEKYTPWLKLIFENVSLSKE